MRHRALIGLVSGALLLLAACSSSGATTAPSAAAPTAEASTAASAPAASAPAASAPAAAACAESTGAGDVAVAIKNFAFGSGDISAKVGQTITFTNNDSAPHTATLDDGSCSTGTISPSSSDGLTFTAAGKYAFHCKIHSSMHGTITVS